MIDGVAILTAVSFLAVDPMLYASRGSGTVKSTDGGETRVGVNIGLNGYLFAVAIDPTTLAGPAVPVRSNYPSRPRNEVTIGVR